MEVQTSSFTLEPDLMPIGGGETPRSYVSVLWIAARSVAGRCYPQYEC